MEKHGNYRYLFPFEKIPFGAKILIYGAGILGQEYLEQILITGYCRVIGFVDQNHEKYPSMIVPVFAPEAIHSLDFDFIVIALRDGFGLPAIRLVLTVQGVEESRIVCVMERPEATSLLQGQAGDELDRVLAYEITRPSIAMYLAGGFGDMVCHKRFVIELIRFVPLAKVDIYVKQNGEYSEWLYENCGWVQNVILDLGFRYREAKDKYSLAISIYGPKFLQVDVLQPEHFERDFPDCYARLLALRDKSKEERISHATPGAIAFGRRIFTGDTCYSWLNYGGIFSIKDWHVPIPFSAKYAEAFKALGLQRYITVNVGNGTSKDGKGVAKSWPLENFEQTICRFKKEYPGVDVVQLGSPEEPLLDGADRHLMGETFGLVAYILRGAIFHLDIEGGLVHLASQIGTKCIVLFGPTPIEYFGYAENINIQAGNCHNCAGLYPSVDMCARHMEKPECMYSITPEIVINRMGECMRAQPHKRGNNAY